MRYTAPAGQAGLLSFRRAWKQVPLHELCNTQTEYITMKKTLITLLALAGAAAADSTPITLPANSDFTWIKGNTFNVTETVPAPTEQNPDATTNVVHNIASTSIVTDNIEKLADNVTDMTGWFGGTGQHHTQTDTYDNNVYGQDISIISSSSFSFKSRPALSGEYVALGVELTEAADSITLTFANDKKVGYSLWSYDGTTATELVAFTGPTAAGTTTVTYDASTIAADSTIFAIWSANPSQGEKGNTLITVSEIGLSYTAALGVPEPATATLSLLALCGLAARRRRH